MARIALAEALLRRKELQERLARMKPLDTPQLFETRTGRKAAAEGLDDIIVQVARVTWAEFEKERNRLAKALRLTDARIQKANWDTVIEVDDVAMED